MNADAAIAIALLAEPFVRGRASEFDTFVLADLASEHIDMACRDLVVPDPELEVREAAMWIADVTHFRQPVHMRHLEPWQRFAGEVRDALAGMPTPQRSFEGLAHARWQRRGRLLGRLRREPELASRLVGVRPSFLGEPAWLPSVVADAARGYSVLAGLRELWAYRGRVDWPLGTLMKDRWVDCPRLFEDNLGRGIVTSSPRSQCWWLSPCRRCRAIHWMTGAANDSAFERNHNPLEQSPRPHTYLLDRE